jgi:hypothetical protein
MIHKLKFDRLTKFILRFAELYHRVKSGLEEEAQASSIYIKYKISTTYEEYKHSGKLLIQSKRGGAYCYMTPAEICADQKIISQIHPIDVNIVTRLHLGAKEKMNTSYIMKQWFSTKKGETIYVICDSSQDSCVEIAESTLLNATHIINCLSVKDCMAIGFGLGVQHSKRITALAS